MMFRIACLFVCCATALVYSHAQAQPMPREAMTLTPALIDAAVQSELICNREENRLLGEPLLQQWLQDHVAAQEARRPASTPRADTDASRGSNASPLAVDWTVLGQGFTEYVALAGFGTDVRWAYSPGSTPEAMAARLVALGYTVRPQVLPMPKEPGKAGGRGAPDDEWQVPALVATRQTPDSASRITLAAGYYPLLHGVARPEALGLTLVCTPQEPNAQELEAATGIWPTRRMAQAVSAKSTLPPDLVEKVLASDYPGPLQTLARYHGLNPAQIDRLLARDQRQIDLNLVANATVALSERQVDALLARNNPTVLRALIIHRLQQLSTAHQDSLRQAPHLAELLTIRQGGEAARALLEQQLRSKTDAEMLGIFRLYELTPELVDTVLAFGSDALRGLMAMQSQFAYTPAQIERMLTDKSRQVQVGVLRRRDLPLTRAQYDRGLQHPDKDVVFWYGQRKNFVPTAAQIEAALTSPEPSTRRGMVFREDVSLTPDQVKRALQDPALRTAVIGRADVKLSEAELDGCTVDPDVSTRFACVRRPDFTLNPLRWRSIARDANGNVLRLLLQRKTAAPEDWPRWLAKSLREDPPEVQRKLLRERLLPFTPELLRLAAQSTHPSVRRSACEREPAACQ